MTQQQQLAALLFPHIENTPAHWIKAYPKRQLDPQAKVTRLGPSPTGFIHLGNLYGAFADERLAHQSGGVFYLRIEDTDDKRKVEGAVETIISSLDFFGLHFDEGAGLTVDKGSYGPYYQSARREIYQSFSKALVEKGLAYPCFLTEEEIASIRSQQEAAKLTPGIYGKWALCRDLSLEQVKKRLDEGQSFVIRLRSRGMEGTENAPAKTFSVRDAIRGQLSMPENFQDVVLLKSNGIPTYHFAHVIDDTLMGTTHVVRGEEWLSSLPVHVELFQALELPLPIYCHTAQLMKIDDETGVKRKLSKRKDPELSLDYYREMGYHPQAVREYLLTILNSDFEQWRLENPEKELEAFPFSAEKMSHSGALFDLSKLNDVSKEVLVKIHASSLADFLTGWAKTYQPQSPLAKADPAFVARILSIGRDGQKPRKDLVFARQMADFTAYFFDETFAVEDPWPENTSPEDCRSILKAYLDTYCHGDTQEQWFDKVRSIGTDLGYAAKPKDYKKNPQDYKGHVGHVSTVIRIALTGRANSPDIWEIQQVLGEHKVRQRMGKALTSL